MLSSRARRRRSVRLVHRSARVARGASERRQRAGAGGHGPASPQESTATRALLGNLGGRRVPRSGPLAGVGVFWISGFAKSSAAATYSISHSLISIARRYSSHESGDGQTSTPGGWLTQFLGNGHVDHAGRHRVFDRLDSGRGRHGRWFPDHFGEKGKFAIVLIGGVLGIITMRFVVALFPDPARALSRAEEGAYYLVAWIGLKLLISGFHRWGIHSGFIFRSRSSGWSCS